MYGSAAGIGVSVTVIVLVALQKISSNLGDLWLAHWVADSPNVTAVPNVLRDLKMTEDDFNLWVFAGLAGANSVVTLALMFVFAYGCLKAARSIHKRLLNRVFSVIF